MYVSMEEKTDSIQSFGCTWWLRSVRHWVKKGKFAESIPCRDIDIFHYLNPSGRSMDLGSNRVITEMITRGLLGGGGGR
jgi:hypothetical protein